MKAAERTDVIGAGEAGRNGCSVPLLHLRGTAYGLRIHGLRRDPGGPLYDNDLCGCSHG
jgi:hypothetical protein